MAQQTRLLKRREEVRESLSKRIEEARNIVTTPIRSFHELAAAAAREKQWREYNCELLRRSFSSSEYPYEYDQSETRVHRVEDSYYNPDLENLVERLDGSIKAQIACLDSIINRLELIPGDAAAAQATSDITRGHADLVQLAERLHRVVCQLRQRHDNRPTLNVSDEYDVQDLVHSLLTIFFNDIRPEEWTPS